MKISIEELRLVKNNIIRKEGYRIVYFYESYHESPQGIYGKTICDLKKEILKKENGTNEDLLNKLLELNNKALGVGVYNVNGTCIFKKITDLKANNTEVYKEELIYDYGKVYYEKGYRIVYFYNNNEYKLGMYSSTLEGFMSDLVEVEPIFSESDIPKFKSVNDILERYLKLNNDNITGIALYNLDGNIIEYKENNKNKSK